MEAKKDLILHSTELAQYETRIETYNNKRHMVVPVVMMVEGVHSGSRGPLLHLASELGKFTDAWNGIPIVIQHPQINGHYVSANIPTVLDSRSVGRVFNTKIENKALKAEAWLEVDALARVSPIAQKYIREHKPLQVSVGVFSDEETKPGTHNGENYTAIARNHRPDHLALLPNEEGACNWADGCGIRVNKADNTLSLGYEALEEVLSNNTSELYENALKAVYRAGAIIANGKDLRELVRTLSDKVDSMDVRRGDNMYTSHYLESVYDNYLVYRKVEREPNQPRTPEYYKQSYLAKDDGTIEFVDDPVQVTKEIKYKVINQNNSKTGGNMSTENQPCKCKEKVDALINNAATNFTEEDRPWLETMNEAQIKAMEPKEVKEVTKIEKGITANEAIQAFKDSLKTTEDFLAIMPEELKQNMQQGLEVNKKYRTQLIDTIINNTQEGMWTKEELEQEPTEKLAKFAKSFAGVEQSTTSYSLNSVNSLQNDKGQSKEEPLLPIGVNAKENK